MSFENCPIIMIELKQFLEQRKHKCVNIIKISDDFKLDWCQKDNCTHVEIKDIEKEEEKFITKLKQENHTCLVNLSDKILWCGCVICEKK